MQHPLNTSIKILHIDSNHPLLWEQLQAAGFDNHEDFTSSKEEIEAKIQHYRGIVIRSRFKIDQQFLDKAVNLPLVKTSSSSLLQRGTEMPLGNTLWP